MTIIGVRVVFKIPKTVQVIVKLLITLKTFQGKTDVRKPLLNTRPQHIQSKYYK